MKALSIKQPWAEAILQGVKRVENRTWGTKYRGPVIVHAGLTFDRKGYDWLVDREVAAVAAGGGEFLWPGRLWQKDFYSRGGFLGVMEITGCSAPGEQSGAADPWRDPAQYGWQIGRVLRFAEPVPGKGRLGLFQPPDEVAVIARRLWAKAAGAA